MYAVDVRTLSYAQRVAVLKFAGLSDEEAVRWQRMRVKDERRHEVYYIERVGDVSHSDWDYYSSNHRSDFPLKEFKFELCAEISVPPPETIVVDGVTYKRVD